MIFRMLLVPNRYELTASIKNKVAFQVQGSYYDDEESFDHRRWTRSIRDPKG